MCSVVRVMSVENVYIITWPYMYTNLLYELGLVGMKGKYGTCKVTSGNDVCVCL